MPYHTIQYVRNNQCRRYYCSSSAAAAAAVVRVFVMQKGFKVFQEFAVTELRWHFCFVYLPCDNHVEIMTEIVV